jgi:hypothetical protein
MAVCAVKSLLQLLSLLLMLPFQLQLPRRISLLLYELLVLELLLATRATRDGGSSASA